MPFWPSARFSRNGAEVFPGLNDADGGSGNSSEMTRCLVRRESSESETVRGSQNDTGLRPPARRITQRIRSSDLSDIAMEKKGSVARGNKCCRVRRSLFDSAGHRSLLLCWLCYPLLGDGQPKGIVCRKPHKFTLAVPSMYEAADHHTIRPENRE
nr:hypothetical protein Iba_chr02bCG12340 [Ipomoea batatas]